MQKSAFTILLLLTCFTSFSQLVTINSSNKSVYFNGNHYKSTAQTIFPDGLKLVGIEAVFEDIDFTFGVNASLTIDLKNNTPATNVGANVQFKGCTFRPENNDSWVGIKVLGFYNEEQINTSTWTFIDAQTRVFFLPYNGDSCLVEKAETGIEVGTNSNNTGALLRCAKTHFINCTRAVVFNAYENNNYSVFRDCVFRWDSYMVTNRFDEWLVEDTNDYVGGNYYGDDIIDRQKHFVELNSVKGVTFIGGNLFENEVTQDEMEATAGATSSCHCNQFRQYFWQCRGVGICAFKSTFTTIRGGTCYYPEDPATTVYDPNDGCIKCTGKRNIFNGLSMGIFVNQSNAADEALITGNRFVNCAHGVRAENGRSLFINRNLFILDYRGSVFYNEQPFHVGIWLMKSGKYDIANNVFNYNAHDSVLYGYDQGELTCTTGLLCAGILVDDAGENVGRSYNNRFLFSKIATSTKCGNPYICELYNGDNKYARIECNHYDLEGTGYSEDWRVANYKHLTIMTFVPGKFNGLHGSHSSVIQSIYSSSLKTPNNNQFMTWTNYAGYSQSNHFSSFNPGGDYHISFRDWNVNPYSSITADMYQHQTWHPYSTLILDNSGNPNPADPWLNIHSGGTPKTCDSSSYCKYFSTETNYDLDYSKTPPSDDEDLTDPKMWQNVRHEYNSLPEITRQNIKFEVYPTIAHSALNILFKSDVALDVNYEVFDLSGKTHISGNLGRSFGLEKAIDISSLSNGMHIIKFYTTNNELYHAYFIKDN
ncbi:hypothetical protein GC194_08365 [bacterium]|nr:hypothetical protein [bacterium]